MEVISLHELLGQSSSREVLALVFNEHIRSSIREMLLTAMEEEVTALCGSAYGRESDEFERGGSAPGQIHLETETIAVARPRVRRKEAGSGREVQLTTYIAGRDGSILRAAVMRALEAGVSSRDQTKVFPNAAGISRSQVSREWQEHAEAKVNELRTRPLPTDPVVLMLDGVRLSADCTAIAAMAIDAEGNKHFLDMQVGASENQEVCTDLLARLVQRGFAPKRRLLVILDGSKALANAVMTLWPDCVIQRCLVHKERNIRAYLPAKRHVELARLFKALRVAQGLEDALVAYRELASWLKRINAQALASLQEAGIELFGVQMLNVPNTLHISLLSTNCIENSFRNLRARIGRVKRWRSETAMAERWLASGLLLAEAGFRRISHYKDLPHLIAALQQPDEWFSAAKEKIVENLAAAEQ